MKERILVVDDDLDIRDTLTFALVSSDYEVNSVSNGFEALEYLKKEVPDIMILDVCMPEIDGYHVCEIIKNNKKYKNISIIFLTGKDTKEDRKIGKEVKGNLYITKPYSLKEIFEAVHKVGG